jgi:hypothetical protein
VSRRDIPTRELPPVPPPYAHGDAEADDNRSAATSRAYEQRLNVAASRVRGSAFYRDPDKALASLWPLLEELGIPSSNGPAANHR